MKRLPFLLLIIVAVVIGAATVVESRYCTECTRHDIYGAWWFVALWAMMCLTGCWLLIHKKMWKRPSAFLLHVGLVVILAGAFLTHVTSQRGFVHLREGEAKRYYVQRDETGELKVKPLPYYMALDSFRIEFDKDGAISDYISYMQISDENEKEKITISMNNIGRCKGYRIFQTSYDDDGRGSIFTISYDPWGTTVTYIGYLLLAAGMIWNGKRKKTSVQSDKPSAFNQALLWFVGILLASYMVVSIAFRPLMPVLRSPLLVIHVGTIMISYTLLVVSVLNRNLLRIAVFFLAAGIFLGAMWANVSWGSYWSWDPKESWALITLIVYSMPLHNESLPWLRSTRNYRIYCLLCFLCLMMTYFGVNYWLGGMHCYAN